MTVSFLASLRTKKSPSHHGISALWKSERLPHEKQGEDRPQEACALHLSDLQGTSLCPILSHAFFLERQHKLFFFFFFFFVCAHREWSTCQVSGISTETWQHEISLWRVSWGWRLEISALPKFCLRTKSTTWSKSQERVPYSGQTSVKTYSICRLNYLLKRGRTDTYRVLIFLGMPLSLWLRASSLWPQMSGALEWCFMSSSPTVTKTAALLQ